MSASLCVLEPVFIFSFLFFLFNSNAFLVGHLEYERIVGMVVMVDATLSGARA